MAETLIDYQISADPAQVKKAMADIERAAGKLGDSIASALTKGGAEGAQGIERGLRNAQTRSATLSTAIGTSIGAGIAQGVRSAIKAIGDLYDNLKEIDDLAKKTGLSTSRIGALQNIGRSEGVSSDDINSGIDKLGAAANKAFREGEGDLKDLLEQNNLKLTDRAGKLKDTNALLFDASRLVQNAKTEFDKIDIARIFGLSEDWVKILEQGPAALKLAIGAAEELGGAFDKEVVQRAADFDKAWTGAWASFLLNAKSAIAQAAAGLAALLSQQNSIGGKITEFIVTDKVKRGFDLTPDEASFAKNRFSGKYAPDSKLGFAINAGDRERLSSFRQSELQGYRTDGGRVFEQSDVRARAGTNAKSKSSGGGGGGKSDEDKAEDRLDRYTDSLKRQSDVLKAEIETFGKSNAERKAAIELAKAKVDLDKVDDETRARLVEGIKAAVAQNEAYRESLDRLKGAQEAARSVASSLADGVADFALEGKNAADIAKSLGKSLLRDLLGGLLAGKGSFAGLFGTKESGGIFGTILSGLFGGKFAGGGELPRGYSIVGENGPEMLRNSGSGVARVYPSGGGSPGAGGGGTVVINADFRGADAGAVVQIKNKLDQMEKSFSRRVQSVTRQSQVRGFA